MNIAFFGAFHGRTMGALSLTASKTIQKKHYYPLAPGITHIPYAYCYRCSYNLSYPGCGIECVRWIEDTLFRTTVPPEEVAAIFVEPIQGEGGVYCSTARVSQRALQDRETLWYSLCGR